MFAPHLHVTDGMSDNLVSLVTLIYCFVPLKALNLKLSTFVPLHLQFVALRLCYKSTYEIIFQAPVQYKETRSVHALLRTGLQSYAVRENVYMFSLHNETIIIVSLWRPCNSYTDDIFRFCFVKPPC